MPALFDKSGAYRRQRMIRSFGRQSEAPRLTPGHLNFADGHVKMPALVTGGGTDVRPINHDDDLIVRVQRRHISGSLGCLGFNLRRNAVRPIADGGVIGWRAWQQRRKQLRGFPKRMARSQLSLNTAQFRCASVWQELRKRRERQINKPHLVRARANADARCVDLDRAKQRLKGPGPTIALPPQRQALTADAGAHHVFLHLGLKYEALKLRKEVFALRQCQPHLVRSQADNMPIEATHLDGFDLSPAAAPPA